MTEHKNLASALVAAQADAQAVYKASKNEFHKYRYASAEDMIEESRGALNRHGLALCSTGWSVRWNPAENERLPRGIVNVGYRLFHVSGETMEFCCETSCIVEKGRPEDKAEATALTYNLGYFCRGLLCLPRSDEKATAVDERDDRHFEPRKPQLATIPKRSAEDLAIDDELELTINVCRTHEELLAEALKAQIEKRPEESKKKLRVVWKNRWADIERSNKQNAGA